MQKEHIIQIEGFETGRLVNGKKELIKRIRINGDKATLFALLFEAIHQQPVLKELMVQAIKFDDTHNHANCPHCRNQN